MKKEIYMIVIAILFGLTANWLMTGGIESLKSKNTGNGPPLQKFKGGTTYDAQSHLFYTPDGKFSVKLPAPPLQYSRMPELVGPWTITTQTPSTAYRVAMTPAKIGVVGTLRPGYWQGWTMNQCQSFASRHLGGTQTRGYPFGLQCGAYPGYCSEGTLPEGSAAGKVYKAECFVFTRNDERRDYCVAAVGTPEGLANQETKEFFDTFTIVP